MPARAASLPRPHALTWCAAVATALWAQVLAAAWPRLMAGGSICGGPALAFGHCAACLPALGATIAAAGLGAAAALQARR